MAPSVKTLAAKHETRVPSQNSQGGKKGKLSSDLYVHSMACICAHTGREKEGGGKAANE